MTTLKTRPRWFWWKNLKSLTLVTRALVTPVRAGLFMAQGVGYELDITLIVRSWAVLTRFDRDQDGGWNDDKAGDLNGGQRTGQTVCSCSSVRMFFATSQTRSLSSSWSPSWSPSNLLKSRFDAFHCLITSLTVNDLRNSKTLQRPFSLLAKPLWITFLLIDVQELTRQLTAESPKSWFLFFRFSVNVVNQCVTKFFVS